MNDQALETADGGDVVIGGGAARLLLGDCLERLKGLADCSVDSVVCDPPYGLSSEPDMVEVLRHWLAGDDYKHKGNGFMGKSWDSFVPGPAIWKEAFRVLKPGGHLLAFFGSRTYDMGTLAIRLAGFDIRDQIMWVYGSGFPKSMDVSKAIDKAEDYHLLSAHRRAYVEAVQEAGLTLPGNSRHDWTVGEHAPGNKWWAEFEAWLPGLSDEQRDRIERIVIGKGFKPRPTYHTEGIGGEAEANEYDITAPATEAARQWQGWGTALKPAHEPICMARKPLIGTVAANVLQHGTGAIAINSCRVLPGTKGKLVSRAKRIVSCVGVEFYESMSNTIPSRNARHWSDMLGKKLPASASLATFACHESESVSICQEPEDSQGYYQVSLHLCDGLARLEEASDQAISQQQLCARTRSHLSMPLGDLAGERLDTLLCECTTRLSSLDFSDLTDPCFHVGYESLRRSVEEYSEQLIQLSHTSKQSDRMLILSRTVISSLLPDTGKILKVSDMLDWDSPFQMLLFNVYVVPYFITNTLMNIVAGTEMTGRWPANLILSDEPEVVALFPNSAGAGGSVPNVKVTGYGSGIGTGSSDYIGGERTKVDSGSGSAARFFTQCSPDAEDIEASRLLYYQKASRKDRNEGLDDPGPQFQHGATLRKVENTETKGNTHPTVKNSALMRHLCRLVTPPGGLILDPFMGSGSTGKAAMLEQFNFIGCELSPEYLEISRARIQHAYDQANPEPVTEAEPAPQLSLFA